MIDDLTNAWHNRSGRAGWEPGGDWGGGLDAPGSALRTLEDGLLRDYPEARVTFFTVAGAISAYTRDQPFSYSAPLDADASSCRFFRTLAADPRFELAYHGYNHGTPGDRTETFVQEWRGFPSHDAAVAQTKLGLEAFVRAVGVRPLGGKYGGWDYNEHAEGAVDASGFLWWCRDWMPRDVSDRRADGYYDPQYFGTGLVVALPSTVHGHFWDTRQVERLLARRQVIAIEEHIAPIRPDGRIQTPNIIDDMADLRRLYRYLRNKDVWHATGSQIASYIIARDRSLVHDIGRDRFSIAYEGRAIRPLLTVEIDCAALCSPEQPAVDVVAPDGQAVAPEAIRLDLRRYRHLVTIPVVAGKYEVRPRSTRPSARRSPAASGGH